MGRKKLGAIFLAALYLALVAGYLSSKAVSFETVAAMLIYLLLSMTHLLLPGSVGVPRAFLDQPNLETPRREFDERCRKEPIIMKPLYYYSVVLALSDLIKMANLSFLQ